MTLIDVSVLRWWLFIFVKKTRYSSECWYDWNIID